MKQKQWALYSVTDPELRRVVEELENQRYPWELHSWQPIGQTVDANNQPTVTIIVCMEREIPDGDQNPPADELVDEVTPKRRGRPKKND